MPHAEIRVDSTDWVAQSSLPQGEFGSVQNHGPGNAFVVTSDSVPSNTVLGTMIPPGKLAEFTFTNGETTYTRKSRNNPTDPLFQFSWGA